MTIAPPAEVTLVYRQVGTLHVFTCAEIPGLHISNRDLERAFEHAIVGLSAHASATFKCAAKYRSVFSFAEFERHLSTDNAMTGPVVAMHLAEDCVTT